MSKFIMRHFRRIWLQHAAMQVATLSVLVGTFVVISLSLLIHQNLASVLGHWGDSVMLSVYLKDSAEEKDLTEVSSKLRALSELESVQFVSKDMAAKTFLSQMSSIAPEVFVDKEFGNPLPASFELKLKPSIKRKGLLEKVKSLGQLIGSWPSVDQVAYGQGWIENYSVIVKIFSRSSWMLILILLSGSLFVIANSIGNSIYQRRDEIEVLELVGATRANIITPYLCEGFVIGFLASAFALLVTLMIFSWQSDLMSTQMGIWALGAQIAFLDWPRLIIVLALGGSFGAMGAWMAVRKITTGWAAADHVKNAL